MKIIRRSPSVLVCLASMMLLLIGHACSRSSELSMQMDRSDIEAKLNVVLQQMISQCDEAMDAEALRAAELFFKLQDMPIEVVGFSVPINSGSNHVHVSFTLNHFQQTAPDVLATEGLEDFQSAKASGRGSPNE